MVDSSSSESSKEGDDDEDEREGGAEMAGVICSAWRASNARRTVSENIVVEVTLIRDLWYGRSVWIWIR